jgi:ATP-dependent DNA ligase
VGGFRYLEKKPLVGSLLLGLYNGKGVLDHVGYTSSIHAEDRPALTKKLEKMIKPPGFTGKAPGGLSRWSTKRSMSWQPLDNKLVVEVQFDHFTADVFATAQSSCAGAQKRTRATAQWGRCGVKTVLRSIFCSKECAQVVPLISEASPQAAGKSPPFRARLAQIRLTSIRLKSI